MSQYDNGTLIVDNYHVNSITKCLTINYNFL